MSWYWLAALAAVAVLGLVSRRGERPDSKEPRPTRTPPPPPEIDNLLRAGQKIEAIKRYRRLHGVDLKTAKDAIDARAREMGR
jgi:ribosomal protein L7/L12